MSKVSALLSVVKAVLVVAPVEGRTAEARSTSSLTVKIWFGGGRSSAASCGRWAKLCASFPIRHVAAVQSFVLNPKSHRCFCFVSLHCFHRPPHARTSASISNKCLFLLFFAFTSRSYVILYRLCVAFTSLRAIQCIAYSFWRLAALL